MHFRGISVQKQNKKELCNFSSEPQTNKKWRKKWRKKCATQHLLFSTSPSPSPFPFPILELKISRFRIFKRTPDPDSIRSGNILQIRRRKEKQKKLGFWNVFKRTFALKIYDKTILSRKFLSSNYCVWESFCWETILVNKMWLHLLLSSFLSLLQLQKSGLFCEADFESIPTKLNGKTFARIDIVKKLQSCRQTHLKMQIFGEK